jgi:hypothetical protein
MIAKALFFALFDLWLENHPKGKQYAEVLLVLWLARIAIAVADLLAIAMIAFVCFSNINAALVAGILGVILLPCGLFLRGRMLDHLASADDQGTRPKSQDLPPPTPPSRNLN